MVLLWQLVAMDEQAILELLLYTTFLVMVGLKDVELLHLIELLATNFEHL
jgi:hypothetical protein